MPLINKRFVLTALLGMLFSVGVCAENLLPAVHIQSLPNLSINHLGIDSRIPADIWGKSDTNTLKSLIKDIVAKPLTPAMQDVITQMMLRQTAPDASLPLTFRMEALMQLGQFDDVLTLDGLVPPTHQTPDILRLKALALFLSGKTKEACEFMVKTSELSQMAEDMRLACAIAKGDKTGAELIFATRLENNELDETTAVLAKKVFLNDDISLEGKEIEIRHLHLLGAVGNKIDWSKITVSPQYQKTMSDLSTVPLHMRLAMAEKYNTDRLDNLYTKADDKTQKNDAVLRAKLYQKIKKNTENKALAEDINEYLESARTGGVFLTLAPVMRPFLDTITPTDAVKSVAFNAVQVYALSDNADLAYAWYQILQNASDEPSKMQGVFLEPLIQQLGGGMPKNVLEGLKFCQTESKAYCAEFWDKIGREAEIADWAEVLNHMPVSQRYSPLVQGALRELVASSRQGEALLYAIKLWQSSTGIEPDMITPLSETAPKSLVRRLILERYVYP